MQIRDNNTGKVQWCFPAELQEVEAKYQNKIRLNKVFPLPKKMYTVLQEAVKERNKEDDGKYTVLQEAVKEKEEEDTGMYTDWEKSAKKEEKIKQAVKEKEKKKNENWRELEKLRLFE